jgi:hypothetical protein
MPDGMGSTGCVASGAVTGGNAATVADVVVELSAIDAEADGVVPEFPEPPHAASASGRHRANSLLWLPRYVEFVIDFVALGPGCKPC